MEKKTTLFALGSRGNRRPTGCTRFPRNLEVGRALFHPAVKTILRTSAEGRRKNKFLEMTQLDQVTSQASWQLSNKISNTRRALKGHALREYKQTITLNPMQREILVGTLHSDDCAGAQASACMPLKRLRVQFEQSMARADYIWHLYDLFGDFVGTPPRVRNNIWGP